METRNCQNCKKDFTINAEDFNFYIKVAVPPPTFCPSCRAQRRMSFLNERTLYKRKCDKTGESVVSLFPEDAEVPVYSPKAWWSDDWDATDYGQEYDFSKPFFEQFGKLLRRVPQFALQNQYTTLIRTDYVNMGTYDKDCYLVFNTSHSEECSFTTFCLYGKQCLDIYMATNCELCYEGTRLHKCYRVFYTDDCADSTDIFFSRSMKGCQNCFGCANLSNKSYYIFNQPYTKEAYFKEIAKYDLGSRAVIQEIIEKTKKLHQACPVRYMEASHNTIPVSGNRIYGCKNTKESFEAYRLEDSKFCQFVFYPPARECYDMTLWGENATRIYECMGAGDSQDMVKFSFDCWAPATNIEYSYHIVTANKDLFGCVGLKNKQYCILNKQYTKEEYEALIPKIKKHMDEMPYVDAKGRVYTYGEFFPTEISLFTYNETMANSYYPLTKEQILEKGFKWKDREENVYAITKKASELPDNIADVDDSILKEVIECEVSKRAFRLTSAELQFCKMMHIPIPRLHPDERHKRRLAKQNPMQLWHRKCMNEGCQNEFETSYAPDRPEIVYCEKCYQNEVM